MDERNRPERETDDGSSDMQRAMIFVVLSLLLVAITSVLEIRFAQWPLGIAGATSILIGGCVVATIPNRLPNRIGVFIAWMFMVVPIWFPLAAHLTCAWRQLCL